MLLSQAVAAVATTPSGELSFAQLLVMAISAVVILVGAVVALWRLDRAQLVERLKEATEEAEKLEVRYEQATTRYQTVVAELAGARADLAREQGRREAQAPRPPLPLPPPSKPS